jgi:hypothetical protein
MGDYTIFNSNSLRTGFLVGGKGDTDVKPMASTGEPNHYFENGDIKG